MKKNKPHLRIGFLGHYRHGKSTLSNAMLAHAISKGQKVYLGCDPGMTREGRELVRMVRELTDSVLNEEIKEAAYFAWIEAGRPDGRDLEFWEIGRSIVRKKHTEKLRE